MKPCTFFPLVLLSLPLLAQADSIKRIQHSDGSVEFSNIDTYSGQYTVIYKSQTREGPVFSDQKPRHDDYEVLKYNCYACNPDSTINWHTISLDTTSYASEIKRIALKYKVDPALVRAVIHAESAFNARALSKKGAQGLMQLMPSTAKELGIRNAFDARQNIEGGVQYLASLLRQFDGDIRLATAAYNAGPSAVKQYNGIPPYPETQVYVERVSILHQRYRHEN